MDRSHTQVAVVIRKWVTLEKRIIELTIIITNNRAGELAVGGFVGFYVCVKLVEIEWE